MSVIGRPIVITAYRLLTSKFIGKNKSGLALQLQFWFYDDQEQHDKRKYVLFTGSDVLIDLIRKYSNEIPFITKIVKINRHFIFQ